MLLPKAATIGGGDAIGGKCYFFVLPDPDYPPTCRCQLKICVAIACLVACDLPVPPLAVRTWSLVVQWTAVPEATVQIDSKPSACEGHVDGSTVVAGNLQLNAVPQAPTMQLGPQELLGCRVPARES